MFRLATGLGGRAGLTDEQIGGRIDERGWFGVYHYLAADLAGGQAIAGKRLYKENRDFFSLAIIGDLGDWVVLQGAA
jgi:hypothetical protein